MKPTKLCIIYNFDQKYRKGIFTLMDKYYSCHWVFGNNDTDIKGIDQGVLKDVAYVTNKKVAGPFYYQKGVTALLFRYDHFVLTSGMPTS